MTQTTVLWLLGGWFVVAAVVSLLMGRMMSHHEREDSMDFVQEPTVQNQPAEELMRPRIAA